MILWLEIVALQLLLQNPLHHKINLSCDAESSFSSSQTLFTDQNILSTASQAHTFRHPIPHVLVFQLHKSIHQSTVIAIVKMQETILKALLVLFVYLLSQVAHVKTNVALLVVIIFTSYLFELGIVSSMLTNMDTVFYGFVFTLMFYDDLSPTVLRDLLIRVSIA